MDWSIQNTKAFIEIIYDRVRKRQLQGSTFKTTIWEDINKELTNVIGENYARTGVTKDSENNGVNDPEEVWVDLCAQGRFYKQFKKYVFEFDYEILGEIFDSITTNGKLSQTPTQEPPISDEERDLEAIDVDEEPDEAGKKMKGIGSKSEHRRKEGEKSRLDKIDAALTYWRKRMKARAE
ncbi:hypothetical protein RJT34_01785 [Clitoria ternatea]|uniref:Myb/SANT-like domain-containing protein n=1 Tax=Clitoria ternatea TaxID=43366 RepID=A0AAN9KJU8_CLITE